MTGPSDAAQLPELTGDALAAVQHRGGHLQIIAGAGSGKTEVVAQRVVDLLAERVPAESIVAFTFTERAAGELKERIAQRAEQRLGRPVLDRLNGLFIGTIHSYCFRLLQQHVPRYETYDVLDDKQLTAFLSREARRLDMKQLDPPKHRLFASIAGFLRAVDIVENELLDPDTMPEPFRTVLVNYYDTLDRYRLLTYGQQIVRAVAELERERLAESIHATLLHLIVDEYQDVNPAQERLIELLTGSETSLCVVGDDQQAVYQWRGSDVNNIVTFGERYRPVTTFEIKVNRRSRPGLIAAANRFAETIPDRIPKTMGTHRPPADGAEPELVAWAADTEQDEVGWVANLILDLIEHGARPRDIAVLVRGRAAYPRLVEQFATFGIPVQPEGRTGLFEQPEARLLGRTFAWLSDIEWRDGYGYGSLVATKELLDEYRAVFALSGAVHRNVARLLGEWKAAVPKENRVADLVGELYELLRVLEVRSWDLSDPLALNRTGTLARFSALLADYESVRRRARLDPDAAGEQVGGQDRGTWYYRNLALHIINYAQGAYEDFDGEPESVLEAIDLTTVHRAKGLEWPAVFLPSLTANRFPSSKSGSRQEWLVPRDRFDAERYEGGDADERRLFYVGMTRARDWLSLSRHERVTKQRTAASPYFEELAEYEVEPEEIDVPNLRSPENNAERELALTYSELALFIDCGLAYRLRNLLGFQPRLAAELGYGKAVHHVMRRMAEETSRLGRVPDEEEIGEILDESFFLPAANKPAHRQLKEAARRLVVSYTQEHAEDLRRVWETERPFELHLDGLTISGRADVILDMEGGVPASLAIVDYKTSTESDGGEHALQLQVYADAGRREGLDVRAAYVHDLKNASREAVPVDPDAVAAAEDVVLNAGARLRKGSYTANPGTRCRKCDVRHMCPHAAG
ncbi:MAG TPA: ATP-dependent DNA helicase [Solirubrobacterales bacterium]|nr:ATP-dependent DNA helicase [Solirubrobacterales bacterium]